jgi:hypothetical protein
MNYESQYRYKERSWGGPGLRCTGIRYLPSHVATGRQPVMAYRKRPGNLGTSTLHYRTYWGVPRFRGQS